MKKFNQKSRKSIVTLLIALLFVVSVNAQQQAVDKVAQAMTDSLAYLKLSDQQKSSALTLNKTAAASLIQLAQKAKQDTTLQGKAAVQQISGILKTRNQGLTQLLNADQQKLYQQHKVQQAADMQTKVMTVQLGLSPEQTQKVYALNLKETQKMMEDAAKLKDSDRKLQKLKAAKSLKSDSGDKDKELKSILNSDQYQKYEQHKQATEAAIKEKMQNK